MKTKSQKNKDITTFDEHLNERYGKIGTKARGFFDTAFETPKRAGSYQV